VTRTSQVVGIESVVLRFIDAINAADLDRISTLMTEGHTFVDSDGSKLVGREAMRKAWSQFFSMTPSCRIDVEEMFSGKNHVVLIGIATGTRVAVGPSETAEAWSVPAAWRAVEEARIATWQVFACPEAMLAAKRSEPPGAP